MEGGQCCASVAIPVSTKFGPSLRTYRVAARRLHSVGEEVVDGKSKQRKIRG